MRRWRVCTAVYALLLLCVCFPAVENVPVTRNSAAARALVDGFAPTLAGAHASASRVLAVTSDAVEGALWLRLSNGLSSSF